MSESILYHRHNFEVIYIDGYGKKTKSSFKETQVFRQKFGQAELDLVPISGGSFMMGSPHSEEGREDCEGPQHVVSVPSFWMGMYPVTQAQYRELMEEAYFGPFFKGETRPADGVCWFNAVEFCRRLSEKTGHTYRLPSEAEWEYACRAGTTTPFYIGETITPQFVDVGSGNYKFFKVRSVDSQKGDMPEVGKFTPNSFGLYDLYGSVQEWCLDGWHENYIGAPADGSAWLPSGIHESLWYKPALSEDFPRLLRSGRRFYYRKHRSACRNYMLPIYPTYGEVLPTPVGFRVVCTSIGSPPPIQSLPSLSRNKTVSSRASQYAAASPKDVTEQLGKGITLTMVNGGLVAIVCLAVVALGIGWMQYISFTQEQEKIAQDKTAAAQREAVIAVNTECWNLTDAVNQNAEFMADFNSEVKSFSEKAAKASSLSDTKTAASQYVAAVNQVVTNLRGLEGDLQAVSLNDETLNQFRDDYVNLVQGYGTALNEVGNAMQPVATVEAVAQFPDRIGQAQQNTRTAITKIEDLYKQESSLIFSINTFCEEVNIQKNESQIGS